jgi:peptidoglycan/LPS O-acetylase OafA/YrhL
MITQQHYYKSLSGLRGLGAIWVTLFHVFFQSKSQLLSVGYLGVDLFFLLSGFIISHAHRTDFATGYRLSEHWQFLQLRLIRIYPLHVFVLVLFAIFVFAAPQFIEQHRDPERFGLIPFLSSLFLIHNWGFGAATVWNGPTWSLSAEWLIYLAFPLISIGVSKIKPKYSLLAALLALLALEVILLLAMAPRGDMGRVGLLRITFEFLAGCFVYRYAVWDRRKTTASLEWIGIAMLLIAIYVPSLHSFAPMSFALLILAVASNHSKIALILGSRPLLFLGDISFSLYMCHWPLIQIRNWAITQKYISEADSLEILLITICVSSIFCWKYVEVPARAFGRQLLNKKSNAKLANRTVDVSSNNV